ncbi:MAG: lysophospholipid acyltransferase family protein [Cellvibrionales bacterium]|jgi:KDO2-lipid IV(A) lauroyltransferase
MAQGVYALLARLPLSVLYGLSSLGAWLLEDIVRYRRSTVEDNLAQAFPSMDAAERRRTRSQFYRNLCDTTVEIIAGSRKPLGFFVQRLTIRNPELLDELSSNGQQSVLVMLAHQGNWEWMLHRAAAQYDMAMAFVYKRLHNTGSDTFSLAARGRFGAEAIEMRDTARNIIRHRRRPRLIYLLGDQSPGQRERVQVTEFLNRPTAFFSGAATLAKSTGFPVAYAHCHRQARGHFEIELLEITRDPGSVDEHWIIERYARLTDQFIRNAPDDWLWSNRRWKHQIAADSTGGSSAPETGSQSNPES